jgi:hypothetical protein
MERGRSGGCPSSSSQTAANRPLEKECVVRDILAEVPELNRVGAQRDAKVFN